LGGRGGKKQQQLYFERLPEKRREKYPEERMLWQLLPAITGIYIL